MLDETEEEQSLKTRRKLRMLLCGIAIFAAFFSLALPAYAKEALHHMEIVGHGEVLVPADYAEIRFSVETAAADADTARKNNNAVLEGIRAACKEKGSLTEESFSLYREPSGTGYVASRLLLVRLNKADGAEGFREQLGNLGATSVYETVYGIHRREAAEKEALTIAVANAKAKAAALGNLSLVGVRENEGHGAAPWLARYTVSGARPQVSVHCEVRAFFKDTSDS